VASHPYIVSCHQSLGVIYTDLDRLQEAEASLQTALKLSQAATECAALTESHIMVRTGVGNTSLSSGLLSLLCQGVSVLIYLMVS
jgi:hypothetical protein